MSNPNDLSGENSTLMFFLVLAKMRSAGGSRRGPDLDFFMPPSPRLMDLPRRDIQSECSAQPLGDKGRAQTPIRRDVGNIRHRHRNRRPSLASPLRKRLYRSGRWYQNPSSTRGCGPSDGSSSVGTSCGGGMGTLEHHKP